MSISPGGSTRTGPAVDGATLTCVALALLFLVKAIKRLTGKEAAGAQGSRECDHCKSFIPVDASVCMFCTRDVEPLVA